MSETIHGHSHDEIHVPGPSWWPLVLSLGLIIGGFGMALNKTTPAVTLGAINSSVGWLSALGGGLLLVIGMGGWLVSNIRDRAHGPSITPEVAAKMGMWMFLGSEVIFFTGLITSFLLLRARSPVDSVEPLVASIPVVSFNTFVLLTSSLTVVMAHHAAVTGNKRQLPLFLLLTIVLGSTFIGFQGYEYLHLYEEGLSWTGTALGTSFFTLTGTHGLHVIVGILWCIVVLVRALQGGFNEKEYGGVEIFGLYWHFVDIVWILLFAIVYLIH
jgi:heme/copper-type cytochrome/quinol oxidase subunit 3